MDTQTPQPYNIHSVLFSNAEKNPAAIAVTAPGQEPLTYERLYKQVDYVVQTLSALGIGRRDRVAIVLPNSPELAVVFLGVWFFIQFLFGSANSIAAESGGGTAWWVHIGGFSAGLICAVYRIFKDEK